MNTIIKLCQPDGSIREMANAIIPPEGAMVRVDQKDLTVTHVLYHYGDNPGDEVNVYVFFRERR